MVAAADFRHDDRTPTPLCLSLSPPPTKSWHSFSLLETDSESQCPSSLEGPEGGQRHTQERRVVPTKKRRWERKRQLSCLS